MLASVLLFPCFSARVFTWLERYDDVQKACQATAGRRKCRIIVAAWERRAHPKLMTIGLLSRKREMAKTRKHNGIDGGSQVEKGSVATISVGRSIFVFGARQMGILLKRLSLVFASSRFRVFAIRLLVYVLT